MPMMICPRRYTLRTTSGHVIAFEPNKPKMVPPSCVDAALAVNILPVDGKPVSRQEQRVQGFVPAAMPTLLREALVLRSIHEMVKENDSACFDGGGRPKVHAIKERTAVDIDASERNKAWERYRDLTATGQEMPDYRNLELVYEVQQASSPKAVREYADLLGIEPSTLEGLTLRELKQEVVAAAVRYEPTITQKLDEPLDDDDE